MPIPRYPQLLLPLMRLLADGAEHGIQDTADALAREFRLTPEERTQQSPRSPTGVWVNKVAWAKAKLSKAKLIESVRDGVYRITPRGATLLAEERTDLAIKDLYRFPEFSTPRSTPKPGTS